MNHLLLKHRPKDTTEEEFKKSWDNVGYSLSALASLLSHLIKENEKVKRDDFDCPNHYAKLAFQAGENKAYDLILSLLPSSSK
jgi:hypothetical protein